MTANVSTFKDNARAQRIIPLCLCGFVAMGLFVSSAHAQSSDTLNRIKRLENEVNTLNRAVYKGEVPVAAVQGSGSGDLEVRLGQLETDLRNLTGKIEQQAYDTQQLQQRTDALEQELRRRIEILEQSGAPAASPAQNPTPDVPPPGLSGADTTPAPLQGTPIANDPATNVTGSETGAVAADAAGLYEQGFAEIKREDYAAAEKTFAAFMKQYPDHALAPNALYWLGETYYVRKDYDKASRTFAEAYQKYPNGPKGADNLLKLGLSLAAKGQKDNACIALGQLKKEYPKGPAPILERGEQELTTLGCK